MLGSEIITTHIKAFLTAVTAIEFYPHRNMAVPLFGIKPDIAANETGVEAVIYHGVPVTVSREKLRTKEKNYR